MVRLCKESGYIRLRSRKNFKLFNTIHRWLWCIISVGEKEKDTDLVYMLSSASLIDGYLFLFLPIYHQTLNLLLTDHWVWLVWTSWQKWNQFITLLFVFFYPIMKLHISKSSNFACIYTILMLTFTGLILFFISHIPFSLKFLHFKRRGN